MVFYQPTEKVLGWGYATHCNILVQELFYMI